MKWRHLTTKHWVTLLLFLMAMTFLATFLPLWLAVHVPKTREVVAKTAELLSLMSENAETRLKVNTNEGLHIYSGVFPWETKNDGVFDTRIHLLVDVKNRYVILWTLPNSGFYLILNTTSTSSPFFFKYGVEEGSGFRLTVDDNQFVLEADYNGKTSQIELERNTSLFVV